MKRYSGQLSRSATVTPTANTRHCLTAFLADALSIAAVTASAGPRRFTNTAGAKDALRILSARKTLIGQRIWEYESSFIRPRFKGGLQVMDKNLIRCSRALTRGEKPPHGKGCTCLLAPAVMPAITSDGGAVRTLVDELAEFSLRLSMSKYECSRLYRDWETDRKSVV